MLKFQASGFNIFTPPPPSPLSAPLVILNELSLRLARLSENESRLGTRDHALENLSPGSTRSDLKVNMAKSGKLNKLNSRKIDSRSCIFSLEN